MFQLASLSKPLGATVVAHQVGVNAISWDTPIVDKLPWFALSDPAVTKMVTVGDMYSHRSGLPDHAGDLLEDLGYDRRYVLDHLRALPLDPFRISYAYTNFGLTAGAEAVAVAAGRSWEDLSQDVLYEPLGMTSTSSRFDEYVARPDRAVGHIHVDGELPPGLRPRPATRGARGRRQQLGQRHDALADDDAGQRKLRRASRSSIPRRCCPRSPRRSCRVPPASPRCDRASTGYGFNVGTTSAARMQLSHSGAFELGVGHQLRHPAVGRRRHRRADQRHARPAFRRRSRRSSPTSSSSARSARTGSSCTTPPSWPWSSRSARSSASSRPPTPRPPAPLSSYVGTYANDFWGPARVTEKDGGLKLALGPKLVVPLKHWDGNVFTFSFVTENSPPGSISKATFDGDKLTLEYYDDGQTGIFTR